MLGEKGIPQPVDRALICPPGCRMGTLSDDERARVMSRSPVGDKYDQSLDRESAFEMLAAQAEAAAKEAETREAEARRQAESEAAEKAEKSPRRRSNRQGVGEAFIKSTMRSIGSRLGRELTRGLLGGLFGRKR